MEMHKKEPKAGNDALALQTSERFRARTLIELLTEAQASINSEIAPELLDKEKQLKNQLNNRALDQLKLQQTKHTDEEENQIKKDIVDIKEELQKLETLIRRSNPRYATIIYPEPLSLQQIQQQVLDDKTILLEYHLGDQRSFLWTVTSSTLLSYELPPRVKIEELARRVYDLLTVRQTVSKEPLEKQLQRAIEADRHYWQAAGELSNMLLGPIATILADKRLLIVGDGALQYIPFAALPLPSKQNRLTDSKEIDRRPVIVEHEVINLPSALTLAIIRSNRLEHKLMPKTIAILADPVFDASDPRLRGNRDNAANRELDRQKPLANRDSEMLFRSATESGIIDDSRLFPRLTFSRQEAIEIAALLDSSEYKQALDFEATRELALSDELSKYRYIHFATHGLINSTNPELSGIVLSLVNETGEWQDGFFRLNDIYNLRLPAEVVVLSACRTALGKEIKGEGLIGLTRGFMYAGAYRVIASLWKVDDRATAELMKHFYQGMFGEKKLTPAAALRSAQIELLSKERWRSPFFWSAFILQGECY
ncbi:MAG: CHAT domain-containing protein, partial [Acidobacteriota bacterium]